MVLYFPTKEVIILTIKATNLGMEGIICTTFGAFSGEAIKMLNSSNHWPLWCWLFVIGGSGLIIRQLLKSTNPIEKILKNSGIGKDDNYPTIIDLDKDSYKIHMPNGTSSEDFKKKSLVIAQAIGRNIEVEFEHIGKSTIKMEILKNTLQTKYKFESIKYNHPTEIPIGYSKKGFVSLHLSDKYPNLLLAGCTGSGKSTCLNQIIINTILTQTPDQPNKQPKVLLNLIDFKSGIEFVHYKKCSIVNTYATDIKPAEDIILQLQKITTDREKLFAKSGVSKIDDYNNRYPHKKLPYHLVIVDEFADLREQKHITAVFDKVIRKGRCSGIFFILSTQRPTVDTIPGNLKANIQCYLAFRTTSARESEIILGYGNQDANQINVPGRGIFQAYNRVEVQPMYIKNDDRTIVPLIKHTYRKEITQNENLTGVIKC
jgi:hypothetical protein